jgi:hypothetical protein
MKRLTQLNKSLQTIAGTNNPNSITDLMKDWFKTKKGEKIASQLNVNDSNQTLVSNINELLTWLGNRSHLKVYILPNDGIASISDIRKAINLKPIVSN